MIKVPMSTYDSFHSCVPQAGTVFQIVDRKTGRIPDLTSHNQIDPKYNYKFPSLSLSLSLNAQQAMARGTSQSQASSSTASRPGTVGAAPRGTAAAAAGMRRRRVGGGGGGSGGFSGGGNGSNMLRFYTDDAPGLKITPTVVLVMSLCFIGFVTALHVFGKLYRYRSGGAA
ncbi:Preprotein translocase Sec [Macleaya cordata]|uniref:Preprotein translocase Sec n=1 Tax=Macleaya cordata TaxID=56857 RepID=A0A200R5Z3_MACCD|nr:Preprotein translocase Sec [Macleaya cordata]